MTVRFKPLLAERGVLPCLTCHKPHDAYWTEPVRSDGYRLAPQWRKGKDGHHYRPVGDASGVLRRLLETGALNGGQIVGVLQ